MSEYTNQDSLVPTAQNGAVSEASESSPLDTLAQLRKSGLKTFGKKARARYVSSVVSVRLAVHSQTAELPDWAPCGSLEKMYRRGWYCAKDHEQSDGRIRTHYCNGRTCLVCSRIRTARLIKGYGKPLSEMADPKFVTLTRQTMPEDELRHAITESRDIIQRASDAMRKAKRPLVAIRKIEVTQRPGDLYHPHYHLIVDGQDASEELVERWMKPHNRNSPGRCDPTPQDIRELDERGVMEIFKYITKLTVKAGNTRAIGSIKRLNLIMLALWNVRTIQPMGISKVKTAEQLTKEAAIKAAMDAIEADSFGAEYEQKLLDLEDLAMAELTGTPEFKRFGEHVLWSWDQQATDWLAHDTGEPLAEYTPLDDFRSFVESTE